MTRRCCCGYKTSIKRFACCIGSQSSAGLGEVAPNWAGNLGAPHAVVAPWYGAQFGIPAADRGTYSDSTPISLWLLPPLRFEWFHADDFFPSPSGSLHPRLAYTGRYEGVVFDQQFSKSELAVCTRFQSGSMVAPFVTQYAALNIEKPSLRGFVTDYSAGTSLQPFNATGAIQSVKIRYVRPVVNGVAVGDIQELSGIYLKHHRAAAGYGIQSLFSCTDQNTFGGYGYTQQGTLTFVGDHKLVEADVPGVDIWLEIEHGGAVIRTKNTFNLVDGATENIGAADFQFSSRVGAFDAIASAASTIKPSIGGHLTLEGLKHKHVRADFKLDWSDYPSAFSNPDSTQEIDLSHPVNWSITYADGIFDCVWTGPTGSGSPPNLSVDLSGELPRLIWRAPGTTFERAAVYVAEQSALYRALPDYSPDTFYFSNETHQGHFRRTGNFVFKFSHAFPTSSGGFYSWPDQIELHRT